MNEVPNGALGVTLEYLLWLADSWSHIEVHVNDILGQWHLYQLPRNHS
jgi:hypothetical protein